MSGRKTLDLRRRRDGMPCMTPVCCPYAGQKHALTLLYNGISLNFMKNHIGVVDTPTFYTEGLVTHRELGGEKTKYRHTSRSEYVFGWNTPKSGTEYGTEYGTSVPPEPA